MTRVRGDDRDRGFTLPEVAVTVVLMGIVMAGISAALINGMQVPQQGHTRALAAADRSFTVQQFDDDISNATAIKVGSGAAPASQDYALSGACGNSQTIFTLTMTDATTVTYALTYGNDGTSPPSPTTKTVALTRQVGGGTPDTMIAGYCKYSPTAEDVLDILTITPGADVGDPDNPSSPYYQTRRIKAKFHIRDSETGDPTEVDMEGSPRTDCRMKSETGAIDPDDPSVTLPYCEPSTS